MSKPLRPSPFSRTLALVPPLLVLTIQVAEADTFVKIENASGGFAISGESTSTGRANWIDAATIQFGVSNPAALVNGVITAGKSAGSDIVITKLLDKSSTALFLSCAQGTRQPKVILELTRLDKDQLRTYYRITLTGVIISSLSSTAGSDGSRPSESVSLSYETIKTEYFLADSSGSLPSSPTTTSTWNFVTNTGK